MRRSSLRSRRIGLTLAAAPRFARRSAPTKNPPDEFTVVTKAPARHPARLQSAPAAARRRRPQRARSRRARPRCAASRRTARARPPRSAPNTARARNSCSRAPTRSRLIPTSGATSPPTSARRTWAPNSRNRLLNQPAGTTPAAAQAQAGADDGDARQPRPRRRLRSRRCEKSLRRSQRLPSRERSSSAMSQRAKPHLRRTPVSVVQQSGPKATQFQLSNGMKVVVIEDHRAPGRHAHAVVPRRRHR